MFLASFLACSENKLASQDDVPGFTTTDTSTPADTAPPPVEVCDGVDNDGDGSVDEGFPDNDLDGRADCVDATCPALDLGVAGPVDPSPACVPATVVVDAPWDVAEEWFRPVGAMGVTVLPVVGNLTDDNGDGRVDDHDIPDIAYAVYGDTRLEVLSGADGTLLLDLPGYDGDGGLAIADATGDGVPELIAETSDQRIAAIDGFGNRVWSSDGFNLLSNWAQPTVADLDGDGLPEVLADLNVLNGESGTTAFSLNPSYGAWRIPIAADLDQDGEQEIVVGNSVFDARGRLLWEVGGLELGIFNAVADVDGDPEGELVFVSGNRFVVYDADGTLLTDVLLPGGASGPPAAADFDGDGAVEFAVPSISVLSLVEADGTVDWSVPIHDASGIAGASGFDFDLDGAYEILYADERDVWVFDGRTGTVRIHDEEHDSATLWEYPLVADVDADGSAEIVFASNLGDSQGITVLGQIDGQWAPSGPTWPVHDFSVTNVEADGHVPARPVPSWQSDNLYRARPPFDPRPGADLSVRITDVCVADCAYGPVQVAVAVANAGTEEVAAGMLLTLYAREDSGERLVAERVLTALPPLTGLVGEVIELTPADIGSRGYVARIDEADEVRECGDDDNWSEWIEFFCP